jgi:hypothetical protein
MASGRMVVPTTPRRSLQALDRDSLRPTNIPPTTMVGHSVEHRISQTPPSQHGSGRAASLPLRPTMHSRLLGWVLRLLRLFQVLRLLDCLTPDKPSMVHLLRLLRHCVATRSALMYRKFRGGRRSPRISRPTYCKTLSSPL